MTQTTKEQKTHTFTETLELSNFRTESKRSSIFYTANFNRSQKQQAKTTPKLNRWG